MKRKTNRTHLSQAAGLLSLGLLLQIAFTYPLWMYDEWRNLPTIPLTNHLALEWFTFDFLNLLALMITLLVIMFAPHRKGWYIFFVILIIVLWLQDTARFQYPIYTFSVLLGLLYFNQEKYETQLTQALQMALIGMYIWAGFYQIHPYYIDWLTTHDWWTLISFDPQNMLAYLPGILAILTAIGLFFSKTRLYAIGIALIYHAVQLGLYWTPNHAHHPSQWVFHIVMICLIFVLFRNHANAIFHATHQYLKTFPIVPYTFIIFGTLPFFQFAMPMHPTLALQPLVTKTATTTFFFHRQDRFCLPPEVEPYVFSKSTELINKKILHLQLNKWFTTELGVPYYMNLYQQKRLLRELCSCLDYEHQGGFSTVERNWWTLEESVVEMRCKE